MEVSVGTERPSNGFTRGGLWRGGLKGRDGNGAGEDDIKGKAKNQSQGQPKNESRKV